MRLPTRRFFEAAGARNTLVRIGADYLSAEYDEEDEGFTFTRARSKRTKAAPPAEPPDPEVQQKPKPAPNRARRKAKDAGSPVAAAEQESAPRRRSARNSGERIAAEPAELHVPKKRSKPGTSRAQQNARKPDENPREEDGDQVELVGGPKRTPVPAEVTKEPTKIALPFADTPIIRRNQEMRKGSDSSRRSSLSMRGRRASSLIDSGTSNGMAASPGRTGNSDCD